MDASIDTHHYKQYHEEFMQNLNGTTATETLLVILPAAIGIFLSTSLYPVLTYIFNSLMFVNWLPFYVDVITIIIPLVLCFTIFSDVHIFVSLVLMLGLLIYVSFLCISCRKSFSYDLLRIILKASKIESKRSFVTNFRSMMNLMTALCILAVDFKVFPRRFAKTETFGYGLMDMGVGLFVISNAIVTPEALGYKAKKQTLSSSMWKVVKSSIPLLLLGGARSFITQQIDYQTHVSEYGVHWNFYITLAVTKILCTLILQFVGSKYSVMISFVTIGIHELVLACGIQTWVLSNAARQDFLTANREGIASSLGYVAIYFTGVRLGQELCGYKHSFQNNLVLMVRLVISSMLLWFAAFICKHYFGVSRRLANIGYISWILAFSTTVLIILMYAELLSWVLNILMKVNTKNNEVNSLPSTMCYVPVTLEAINYNGLLFFLVANLLTGLINICVPTLTVGLLLSVFIICIYIIVLCIFIFLLYIKNLKFKVW